MGSGILMCLAGLAGGIFFVTGLPEGGILPYLPPMAVAWLFYAGWNRFLNLDPAHLLRQAARFTFFFLAGSVSVTLTDRIPETQSPAGMECVVSVVSYREVNERMGHLVVNLRSVRDSTGWKKSAGRILLKIRPEKQVRYQTRQLWHFRSLVLTPVSTKRTPSGFIPSRYWLSRGVRLESSFPRTGARLLSEPGYIPLTTRFANWQAKLVRRIDSLSLSGHSRALIKAMIYGDRSDIDDSLMNDFSRAGIIHVLSVSGLHVGIIYMLCAWMLRQPGLIRPRIRSLTALAVVWLYTGITGFSPSALRSAAMISLFEFARLGRRGTSGLDVLGGTAILHLLADPYALFSAGAQLSYLAVAGMMYWNTLYGPLLLKMSRVPKYLAGNVAVSLSAQSLITPLLIFWFGWFPLYFLLGNLILLPLMIIGFYAGLLIVLMDFAGLKFNLLFRGMDGMISLASDGAGWLGNLPGNLFRPDGLIFADAVIYLFLLFSAHAYLSKPLPNRLMRTIGGLAMLLVIRYGTVWLTG